MLDSEGEFRKLITESGCDGVHMPKIRPDLRSQTNAVPRVSGIAKAKVTLPQVVEVHRLIVLEAPASKDDRPLCPDFDILITARGNNTGYPFAFCNQ